MNNQYNQDIGNNMSKELDHQRMAHVSDDTVCKMLDQGHYLVHFEDETLRHGRKVHERSKKQKNFHANALSQS